MWRMYLSCFRNQHPPAPRTQDSGVTFSQVHKFTTDQPSHALHFHGLSSRCSSRWKCDLERKRKGNAQSTWQRSKKKPNRFVSEMQPACHRYCRVKSEAVRTPVIGGMQEFLLQDSRQSTSLDEFRVRSGIVAFFLCELPLPCK